MLKFLTSRKTVIAVVLLVCATVLTIAGGMTTDNWIEFVKWIYGIFVVGNVGSKLFEKSNGKD